MRVAYCGVTHPHAVAHLRTLQLIEEVESVRLWDPDPEAAARTQCELGGKVHGVYADLDALANDRPFFAFVSMRNDQAADLCIRLLNAGLHVLSEKPLGLNANEAERVVLAAEEAGVQLGVCYQNRWHPVSAQARALTADGLIGPLIGCEARMVTSAVRFRNPGHWLFDSKTSGGGILSWLGCHYIDLFRYITGDEVIAVTALAATRSGEEIDVEDVASISFRFAGGAVGTLHAGYELPLSGAGYLGPSYDTYLAFRGRTGRLFWTPMGSSPELRAESVDPRWAPAPSRSFTYELPRSEAYGGQFGLEFLRRFIASCQGDGEPPASGRDALAVARIIDAAYESNRTGRRVDLA